MRDRYIVSTPGHPEYPTEAGAVQEAERRVLTNDGSAVYVAKIVLMVQRRTELIPLSVEDK